MPTKVKGLEYQAEQPAFLQRMRQGVPQAGEKHERPIPRPKRAKADDDDDAPAYVMEDTNESVTKEDYEKLVKGPEAGDEATSAPDSGDKDREASADNPVMSGALPDDKEKTADQQDRPKVKEASLGQKKRKAATAVGQDDEESADTDDAPKPKKGKKKGKPIKLSFDDDQS
ncbi:hypothetical protein KVT40_000273 [Elsinoe batatas]|uniref:DUF4604 domain-containing protein n=1 Tax=Elsinoe batatas TaxID=2601811 RepID=A0A8K0LFB3_9PEZI|nr:hypothetical protein KVT40_000273 [Elsinoe batatas]